MLKPHILFLAFLWAVPGVSVLAAGVLEVPVQDAEGRAIRLQDLDGEYFLVDFWASWCSSCRQSFPWLNRMQSAYRDSGLVVVGVNEDEDEQAAHRFLSRYPAHFKIVRDPGGRLAEAAGVEGMPMTLLIARDGRVLFRHTGFREDESGRLEHAIVAAIGGKRQ